MLTVRKVGIYHTYSTWQASLIYPIWSKTGGLKGLRLHVDSLLFAYFIQISQVPQMAPDTQMLFLNQTLEKTKCVGLL